MTSRRLFDEPTQKTPKLSEEQKRTAKLLRGKTIASVALFPFTRGNGSGAATDPVITFTDGSCLRFNVEETEMGEYGVTLHYPGRAKVKP
jgi:hypothetical protein